MREANWLSVWGGCGLPYAQGRALRVHTPPAPRPNVCPGDPELWVGRVPSRVGEDGRDLTWSAPSSAPQPGFSRQGQEGRSCQTPQASTPSLHPLWFSRTPTVALASAALAFLSRALEASRSRRRFCRSRLSFCCGVGSGGNQGREPHGCHGRPPAPGGPAHRTIWSRQGN